VRPLTASPNAREASAPSSKMKHARDESRSNFSW
jgi:hypothetical protein